MPSPLLFRESMKNKTFIFSFCCSTLGPNRDSCLSVSISLFPSSTLASISIHSVEQPRSYNFELKVTREATSKKWAHPKHAACATHTITTKLGSAVPQGTSFVAS